MLSGAMSSFRCACAPLGYLVLCSPWRTPLSSMLHITTAALFWMRDWAQLPAPMCACWSMHLKDGCLRCAGEAAAAGAPALHVVYINTSLRTKALAHAAVPTITCTSSNVVQTVLQVFWQLTHLRLLTLLRSVCCEAGLCLACTSALGRHEHPGLQQAQHPLSKSRQWIQAVNGWGTARKLSVRELSYHRALCDTHARGGVCGF